jgi:hypothetical protein
MDLAFLLAFHQVQLDLLYLKEKVLQKKLEEKPIILKY